MASTGHYVDPGGSARDNPGYTDQVTYSLTYTAQVRRVGPVRAAKAATAATARVHAVVKATNAQIAQEKKAAQQKKAAAARKAAARRAGKKTLQPKDKPATPAAGSDPTPCGYTAFCSYSGWPLPPKPTVTQTNELSNRMFVHVGTCTKLTITNYQNSNSDLGLGFGDWFIGAGSRTQYYDQYDPMTESLARDGNNRALMEALPGYLAEGKLSGLAPYTDGRGLISKVRNFFPDWVGIFGGPRGADGVIGSYEERWSAEEIAPGVDEAYFTLTSNTGLASFTHVLPDAPWRTGPISTIAETFQWQEQVTWNQG